MLIACLSQAHAQRSKKPFLYEKGGRRRGALHLLASCPDGCTEAVMLPHGLSIERSVELIRAELASVKTERMRAGRQPIMVAHMRITRLSDGRWRGAPSNPAEVYDEAAK
jgi:hypothetical protein